MNMNPFVGFDDTRPLLRQAVRDTDLSPLGDREFWIIRDLFGRVRLLWPAGPQDEFDEAAHRALQVLAANIHERLGSHSYEPDDLVLLTSPESLEALRLDAVREQVGDVLYYFVDRLVTGGDWTSVAGDAAESQPLRITLFSIKGGVGRTTTAAALAHDLASKGQRVLILDLDLESPGISSMLLDAERHPEFGIVDWFVEDLVGQAEHVIQGMVGRPAWPRDLAGDVIVVPAYGRNWGEYIAKLGRVYLDKSAADGRLVPWGQRLAQLIGALERQEIPDVVIIDSRSGLHDIAATVVTDLNAQVLLFAHESESTWSGYRMLFEHWRSYDTERKLRDRLWLVAAMVPPGREHQYLEDFRERAWDLFRDTMYDEIPPDAEPSMTEELFSFDLDDDAAPHVPLRIYWNEGLTGLSSLLDFSEAAVTLTYQRFFERFNLIWENWRRGE